MKIQKSKPIHLDKLTQVSERSSPVFKDGVIYIDDFYENPEDITKWILSQPLPFWKYSNDNTRNGKDYNDCRLVHTFGHDINKWEQQKMNRILHACRRYFFKGEYHFNRVHEFNCFQTKTVFDNKLQHFPHTDDDLSQYDEFSTLNVIIYLDKEADGGTAVYSGEDVYNDEANNLLFPVEDHFDIEQIIPAQYNRCVIFPGNRYHGAYINDYNKYSEKNNSWRLSQVFFLHPQK